MDVVFMKEFPVLPSICDAAGALSYPGAFECFMDIATQHADRLGVGLRDLQPRNLFWLTVKTKIVFLCRPRMGENTTLITWPEVPGRLRCMRSYEMRQGDKLLLCAKTEWAVVDTATQRMVPASEVFPNGDLFRRDTACTEAFTMIPDHFDGINPYAQYTVRSTDIDVGGHMNNAAKSLRRRTSARWMRCFAPPALKGMNCCGSARRHPKAFRSAQHVKAKRFSSQPLNAKKLPERQASS